jgi:hypothetical protein
MVASVSFGQIATDSGHICKKQVLDGDTMAVVDLGQVVVFEQKHFKSERERRKYNRLRKKVVKVYPYAYAAGELMRKYEDELQQLQTKRERKDFLNAAEEELKERFEGELRKMTVTEGIILIKLIDRETGDTSYGLLQELKGNFSAFMWQSVARLFGHNLKDDYDPYGEDWPVEEVVLQIEQGWIEVDLDKAKELQAKAE